MSVHVFLGPSLPLEQARAVLDAEYHPPVSCGDVTELVLDREPPRCILIIDGLFEQVPTVWHKEILFAISRGVRVFGASSMGALRAAELDTFGMEGVGRVYERFAAGEYQDDDEVTIVHAPAEDGHQPLSEAMVNLRAGLESALESGAISASTHDLLVGAAKRTFYPERSWGQLYASAKQLDVPAEELAALRAHVRERRPDAKRDDALALLHHVREQLEAGLRPAVADFELEPTYYWEKLLAVVRQQRAERSLRRRTGLEPSQVYDYLAEHHAQVLRATLCDVLVEQDSARMGLLVSDELMERQLARQRAEKGAGGTLPDDLLPVVAEREAKATVLTHRLRAALAEPVLARLERHGLVEELREGGGRPAAAAPGSTGAQGREEAALPQPAGRRE